MKQLLQNLRTGETVVAEVPIPTPRSGTALVCSAISLVSPGTERMVVEFAGKSLVNKARARPDLVRQALDKARREGVLNTLEAVSNRLDQPMPLGYSSAGTIFALGEKMQGFRVGQRVACAGGGYAVHAEYTVVPRNLLTILPDEVDFESAAFVTLGAIALHGFRLAEASIGERIAVIGLGLLGLLTVGIARAASCQVLGIDLDPWRVELASAMGADIAVLRDRAESVVAAFTHGLGCDAVLICADSITNDPVELAGEISRDRARVVAVGAVGLNLPRKIYYQKELTFINSRSYGPGRYDPSYEENGHDYPFGYIRWTEGRNLEAFVELLASRRIAVQPLITHRYPIEQAPAAYDLISRRIKNTSLGVLLTYSDKTASDLQKALATQTQTTPGETIPGEKPDQSPLPAVSIRPEKCQLGVLGAGNFATTVLLPALSSHPNLELVGIASASGLSAQHAAERFGFQYSTGDETQIFNDPAINTVAILTRHNLHARQVLSSLRAGKHVFCEKPLAIQEEELDELAEVITGIDGSGTSERGTSDSQPTGSVLTSPLVMVGFNRRFSPMGQRLKAFLETRQEPLVAHYRVNAGYLPLTHWLHDPEQGGGRLIGEGCHFIDFLTFLVGSPPSSVSAIALPDSGRYQEDNLILTLNFPDDSIGVILYLANGDKAFPKERIEVFTNGSVALLDDFRSLEMVRSGHREALRARLRQDKGHRSAWEAFVNAILSGGPPPIPYHHLLGVSRAAIAAQNSLRSGERCRVSS